jgi:hypothetical protein
MVGTGRFELPRPGFASHPSQALFLRSRSAVALQIGALAAGSSQANLPLQAEVSGGFLNGRDGQI